MKKLLGIIAFAGLAASALAWNPFQSDSSWSRHDSAPPPPPPPRHGGWGGHEQPPPPPPRGGDWRDGHRDAPHGGGKRHGYTMLGEFSAAGGAKEVSIGGNRTKVYIEFTTGITSINTIVIRSGGRKTPVTVATRFSQGQRYDLDVGRDATGLRISCSGNGRFRVYAR